MPQVLSLYMAPPVLVILRFLRILCTQSPSRVSHYDLYRLKFQVHVYEDNCVAFFLIERLIFHNINSRLGIMSPAGSSAMMIAGLSAT